MSIILSYPTCNGRLNALTQIKQNDCDRPHDTQHRQSEQLRGGSGIFGAFCQLVFFSGRVIDGGFDGCIEQFSDQRNKRRDNQQHFGRGVEIEDEG